MIPAGTTFTIKEISEATGIPVKTITTRIRKMRQKGFLPPKKAPNSRETSFFTYEQVKMIAAKPMKRKITPRPSYINLLKTNLQNDGYKIAKGGNT